MKKLLLLALVVLGGVMNASATDDLYLRSNLNAENNNYYSWNYNVGSNQGSEYKFTWVGKNDSNEDVYTYTIDASNFTGDIYFRLWIYNWTEQLKPSQGQYTLNLSNSSLSEGYTINSYWDNYKHTGDASNYFIISNSTIKASEYKITVYKKNNTFVNNGTGEIWMNVEIVSMPAKVSSLGFSTFSSSYALDLDNASDGLTAYKASVNGGKVVLTKATGKVEAGTGLLLAGTTGTIPVVETSAASALSGNLLHGTVTTTNVAASVSGTYHYFLAGTTADNIGFYNLASAADCGAGKAYLETTTALSSDPATARVAWIFEDESTGIQNAQLQSNNNGLWFDLQGRRVAQPTKGLYIVNGKKVMVK